jgi:hypothetical protein
MNKLIRFLFIYIASIQMAFGAIIVRLPAGQRYSYSINELRAKIKDYYAIIHGKDSQPDCELVEAQSYDLNQEVNGTVSTQSIAIDEYEEFSKFFFEEVSYILTQSNKGAMTKEEVDQQILNPAFEKGLTQEQIESILDETAHLPNFVEAFGEKVQNIEAEAQRRRTTIAVGENTRANWQSILNDMKKNACGHYITKTRWHDQPIEEGTTEHCKVKHIDGDIDKFSAEMMRHEEEEKIMGHLNESDPLLHERFDLARTYQQEVEKYIADHDFPINLRQKLFVEYLENVALPFRDLIVARRAYVKDELSLNGFYDALLSAVPVALTSEKGPEFVKKIQDGTNSYFASNSLRVIEERYDGKAGSYITGYRLEYDRTKIYYRDLKTLMHAPTKRNYVQAMKWMTLGMMATQGLTYNAILGEDSKGYDLPKSCQGDHNSDLPSNFWVADDGMNRAQMLDSIVDNLRILPGFEEQYGNRAKAIDYTAIETYINNTQGNPYENGYAGISPLERYVWAEYGLKNTNYGPYGKPEFDDNTNYTSVIQQMMPEVMEVYEKEKKTRAGRGANGKKSRKYTLTYKDIEEIQKILKPAKEGMVYETDDGESFVGSALNVSEFIAERMQRNGISKVELLFSPIKENFNQTIRHPFPGFYGSTVWKQIALKEMAKYFEKHQKVEKNNRVYQIIRQACTVYDSSGSYNGMYSDYGGYSGNHSTSISSFCNSKSDHLVESLYKELKYFLTKEKYVAAKKYEEIGLKHRWSMLGKIWSALSYRAPDFTAGRETEYDFLMRSMKAGNKWAMARLGFVYFKEELSEIRAQFDPEYNRHARRGRVLTKNSSCYIRNVAIRVRNLEEAADILKLDKPISRFHGTKVLDKDQKKAIFETTLSQFNSAQMSMGLFTAEIKKKPAFKILNEIGYENLFSKSKIEAFAKKNFGENLSEAAQDELDEYLETHEAKITDFFVDILNPESDQRSHDQRIEDNRDRMMQFLTVYGDPSNFNSRESLIVRDNQLKRIIAKDVIRRAVEAKKGELEEAISEFCKLDKDDHEQAKTIFYAASQNQVRLNQLLGLDNEVLKKINENINALSKEEKQDIWIGLGLAALSMGAILIGALCTAGTGGLCAPIGVAMMAAGVGALALQYDLFQRELTRKFNADEYEEYVQKMEGLGFANKGSSSAVSRWWIWTIIEGIGFIPLFNIVFKSIGAGSKVVAATSRAFFKQLSKQGANWSNLKNAWRMSGRAGSIAYREWDIKIAHALLGLSNVDDAVDGGLEVAERVTKGTKAAQEAADNLKKLRALHDAGKISLREVMRQVSKQLENLSTAAIKNYDDIGRLRTLITKVDVRQLNRATAKQMASYWGGNVGEFTKFFKSYWGKWTVGATNAAYRGDKIKFAVDMVAKAKRKEFWFGKNWWVKFRFGHMADVSENMKNMRGHLEVLEQTGKLSINGRVVTTLEGYILENMEEVSKVFIKMPVRKRELPFMIFWLGGPEVTSPTLARLTGIKWFKSGQSLRYGGMHWMGNGIAMKKLINSRAILLSEIQRNVVNNILKVPQEVAPQLFAYSMTRFSQSMDMVAESILRQQMDQLGLNSADDLAKRFGIKKSKLEEFMKIVMRSETNEELGEAVGQLGLSIKQHNEVMAVFQPIFDQKAKFVGKMKSMKMEAAMHARQMISGSPRFRDDFYNAMMAIFDTIRRKDGSFKHIFKIFPSMFSAADKALNPSTKKAVIELLDMDPDTLMRVMWEPATDAEAMLAEALWRKVQPQTFLKGIPENEFAHEAGGILLKEMDAFKSKSHMLLDEVGADEAFSQFYDYYMNALKVQVMQKNPGFIDYF